MGSKNTFKTFSMSTTIREMNRIPDLINIIIKLEKSGKNNISTKQNKIDYVAEIIKGGFITSNKVDNNILEKINMNIELTDTEVNNFMEQAPQKPGWDGRLSNYLNKTESLGFAYRITKNSETFIKVTSLGKFFIEKPIEAIYWSLVNIPVNNPFKRNLNSFTVLGSLCYFMKKNNVYQISKTKLAFLISIKTMDDIDNYDYNSITLDMVKNVLSPSISKGTINDYVDEMIRTLIFAKLFTREYGGIKVTKFLTSKIDKIIQLSRGRIKFFENEISTKESMINWIESNNFNDLFDDSEIMLNTQTKILKLTNKFRTQDLKEWIHSIVYNKSNGDTIHKSLKMIKRFVIIEWLVALLLAKQNNKIIIPNLSLDIEGYPIAQAGANKPDIEIIDKISNEISIVEVTLINNRTQLLNSETTNLIRHLENVKGNELYLIAPKIHEDIKMFFDYVSNNRHIIARGISFRLFLQKFPELELKGIHN